ncbi:MAG: phytanoyl-CoA dioxygenase family protein [Actinobacteria bacterium]|nr:phytanoyl-CoA dioxygenase family protein [Actinomycetota bacterium]
MATHESVETVLRIPRLFSTMSAAKSFSSQSAPPASTDGDVQFKMRSAMDLHPSVGKWVSRRVVRQSDPQAGVIADPTSSRFIPADEIDAAVQGISQNGFYVFNRTVDQSITDAIRAHAESAPSIARGAGTPPAPIPRTAPLVGRYDLVEEVSLQCPEVQEFATDPAMATIAQRYLGQPVLMDEVAFWWTTVQRAEDADINAQLFHQDRDRLSFLKFFIYLTDVTPDSGPHVYLKGSHRSLPWGLRGDGRKTDEAVRKAGLWDNVTELCGPAGTIMGVDTIGLHKGKTPISGDRLALENEFSTALFGMDYEQPRFTPTELVRERFAAMPWVLQRYANAVNG